MQKKDTSSVIEAAGGLLWRKERGKREVALIHRVDYDDWSLPKGKRTGDEDWKSAALREVLEETGYRAKIESFAGSLTYMIEGKPKVVLFWHMTPVEYQPEAMNGEVDQVVWLPDQKAVEKLDYEDEKQLLSSQTRTRVGGT